MALARTDHSFHFFDNSGFVAQGTGPFATGNFTPSDNSLVVAAVMCGTDAPGSGDAGFVTTGGSLTWTKRVNRTITFAADNGLIHQIWTAPMTTGALMAVTSTHTGISSYAFGIAVYSYTGHDTSTPTAGFSSGDSTSTTNSLTLSAAPDSGDDVLAFINVTAANGNGSDASATPGSSFIELFETNSPDSFEKWQAQARTGSTSDAVSWTSATSASSPFDQRIFSALTIKVAAAGGGAARAVGSGLTESRLLQRTRLFKGHSMVGWRAQRGLLVPERRLAA
jgi:hypothetical protein